MNQSNKLLSDIVSFRTYSKYLPTLNRREALEESVNRNLLMNLEKFASKSKTLSKDIIKCYEKVHSLEIMPSMRALQFSGPAILQNNLRNFNCSFTNIDDTRVFGEIFFLLLSGCGVGFSVQNHHIKNLPQIQLPKEEGRFIVHDSITGWAQSVDILLEAYFYGRIRPVFDFSQIRPKGSYLHTTGAKAPGPEPLKYMLMILDKKLKSSIGRKLNDIELHDIVCIISDCVLSGGIRRSSLISLFDRDSWQMLNAKSGEWYLEHPYRARANNSVVLPREEVNEEEFRAIFEVTQKSGSGEPGISWANDKYNSGFNPCHEIALTSNQLCNLTTINLTTVKDKADFLKRVHSATLLGTLQAAYTDFPYLRPIWKETTEREALLGVSLTGIADRPDIPNEWLQEGAKLAAEMNEKYAKMIGINKAARITTLKPEGSSSCVLSSSSGIHDRHSQYYIRRVRMSEDDSLAKYLSWKIPELMEDDLFAKNTVIVSIPQESPKNSFIRENTSALDLLARAMKFNRNWIFPGHREGPNKNNVSVTVSVKPEEWDKVCEFMWQNKEDYSGISLMPFDGGTYKQAPFESITKEKYEELSAIIKDIDLKQVKEESDLTERTSIVACGGQNGSCEIV